jgi:hypothetical protein
MTLPCTASARRHWPRSPTKTGEDARACAALRGRERAEPRAEPRVALPGRGWTRAGRTPTATEQRPVLPALDDLAVRSSVEQAGSRCPVVGIARHTLWRPVTMMELPLGCEESLTLCIALPLAPELVGDVFYGLGKCCRGRKRDADDRSSRRAVYVAPGVLTLSDSPAFAQGLVSLGALCARPSADTGTT